MAGIRALLEPASIAVIGASSNPDKPGGTIVSQLIRGGYQGELFPINPNAREVMGRRCYASLIDVPRQVDLVFIVVPRERVEGAVRQCAEARAASACIITAGFSETGRDGWEAEQRLLEIARSSGLRLAGPNTIGVISADHRMMGSFIEFPKWQNGGISIFSQSGIFNGAPMLEWMERPIQRPPVSKVVAVGNKIDIDEIDFLDYAETDPATKAIGLYLESVRNPDALFSTLARVRRTKPIVVMKSGRTAKGAAASLLHTGSPPIDDAIVEAGLSAAGVARAYDEDEFIGALRALAILPRPKGRRVGIATTTGAFGVLATDLIASEGLEMATFSPETLATLQTIFPEWQAPSNPFDFWISVGIKGSEAAHTIALEALFADPNVDMVFGMLLVPKSADFRTFAPLMRRLRQTYAKPCVLLIMGDDTARRWSQEIDGDGIPIYNSTRPAIRALKLLADATI